MKSLTVKELREEIRKQINEAYGAIGGKLRSSGNKNAKQQFKIGFVPDENEELSSYTANKRYPGSVDAWAEVVHEFRPEFPFDDDFSIRRHSLFFRIGDELRVALDTDPQTEIARWVPSAAEGQGDWFEL